MINTENKALVQNSISGSRRKVLRISPTKPLPLLWPMTGRAMAEIYWRPSNVEIFHAGHSSSRL